LLWLDQSNSTDGLLLATVLHWNVATAHTAGKGVVFPNWIKTQISVLVLHLSYRQRKRELSTDAQALPISGKTPQKHIVWHVLYFSCTIAGKSKRVGDIGRSKLGHCDVCAKKRSRQAM
jgi:hypothetical protein